MMFTKENTRTVEKLASLHMLRLDTMSGETMMGGQTREEGGHLQVNQASLEIFSQIYENILVKSVKIFQFCLPQQPGWE